MDNSELSKFKKQLQLINETVSNDIYNLGDKFFENIVIKLNEALSADYTFIGELKENIIEIETIALANKVGIIDNFIYQLKDTPCENVVGQNPCSYSKKITALFPKDQLLIDMEIEAYVGVPLYDSKSQPTGILVCLFKYPLEDTFAIESILMIFASRASAELEHMKLYASLEKHKQELELKVEERTQELKTRNKELKLFNNKLQDRNRIIDEKNIKLKLTMKRLRNTQMQLVQSEKMASLGILTAGVAHEINNPLNYILGGYTGLKKYFEKTEQVDNGQVKILLNSINVGVKRVAKIVSSLNLFSRNKESFTEVGNVHEIIDGCLVILNNSMKNRINIHKNYTTSDDVIKGNIGKLHQVFLNILNNANQAIVNQGKISIVTQIIKSNIIIKITDNGCGISKDNITKIMDPFFTSKEPGVGIGLGLSITYSLIKEHKGTLEFESTENKGTTAIITLPQIL